jgi:hypothetical protein
MFFQKKSPAADLAIDPIKHEITGKKAREGVDMEETSEEENARGYNDDDDDDDGGGAATFEVRKDCETAHPFHRRDRAQLETTG